MDAAELAVRETLRRARKVYTTGAGSTLELLREADRDLSERLHKQVGEAGKERFTAARAHLYRQQIRIATTYLEKRLAGRTHETAMRAVRVGLKETVETAKRLEKRFTGITQPLALETQARQDHVVHGIGASLLRRHQASFNRYGQTMVADFERVIRSGQLQGLTQEQVISRLVEAGKHGGVNARSLNQTEPGSFPEPTSYVKRRYWAERIVRTETAHAYNAAALQTMTETRKEDFPDLQKKILATFDLRTAPDSVAVHGQVRKLEDYFTDGAGRTYLQPPGRPNDRETIIPWRPHWTETESSAPPPPAVQAKAEVEAQPKPPEQTEKERREQLVQAVQAAKARLLARQQAQAKQTEAGSAKPQTEPTNTEKRVSKAEKERERREKRDQQLAAKRQRELETARKRAEAEAKAALRARKAEAKAKAGLEKLASKVPGKHLVGEFIVSDGVPKSVVKAVHEAVNRANLPGVARVVIGQAGEANGQYYASQNPALRIRAKRSGGGPGQLPDQPAPQKEWSVSESRKDGVEAVQATTFHELGHHAHMFGNAEYSESGTPEDRVIGAKVEKLVRELWEHPRREFTTDYAVAKDTPDKLRSSEYFAEAFAAYHVDPEWLRKNAPRAYATVEQVIALRQGKK